MELLAVDNLGIYFYLWKTSIKLLSAYILLLYFDDARFLFCMKSN